MLEWLAVITGQTMKKQRQSDNYKRIHRKTHTKKEEFNKKTN